MGDNVLEQVAAPLPLMDAVDLPVPVRTKRKAHVQVEIFGERRSKQPKPARPEVLFARCVQGNRAMALLLTLFLLAI